MKINKVEENFERIFQNSEENNKKMKEEHGGQENKILSKYKYYLRDKITGDLYKS